MEQIAINILPKGAKPVCHSSQFDDGRQIRFKLFNDDTPYTLSGTETISVLVHKPDGTEVIDSVTNTSDNYVIWDVPADACELSGVCECELSIVKNGIVLGSKNFTMKVEEDAYNGKNIEVRTASGRIATFNTNMVEAFKSLKSDITPVQDLHGYSKPWSGGGGKNKANKANDLPSGSGITVAVANDGTLTINGTSTEICYIRGYFNCPDSTATYTWALFNNKAFESGVEFSVRKSDNSSAGGWAIVNATNKTFSFIPSAAPTKWQFQISSGITFNNAVFKPMIVSGNTAPTDFEPYSNICPISGFSALNVTRTGKNKLNYDAWKTTGITRGTAVWENNGVTLTATSNDCFTIANERIPVTEGEIITLSWEEDTNQEGIIYIFPNGSNSGLVRVSNRVQKYISYTVPSGVTFVTFRFGVANSGDTIAYKNIQIEKGSTATDFEPYNGQTKTVNFGQTVYGGVLDVTNGKLTITHKVLSIDNNSALYSSGNSAYLSITDAKIVNEYASAISDKYEYNTWSVATNEDNNFFTLYKNTAWSNARLAFNRNGLSLADFITSLTNNPIQVVYELATPIEITTTPENLTAIVGVNNIYSDANGDTEVKYYIEV